MKTRLATLAITGGVLAYATPSQPSWLMATGWVLWGILAGITVQQVHRNV